MKLLGPTGVVLVVLLVAFALWLPSTHETKGERIDRLEQQVGELQGRVEKLESK